MCAFPSALPSSSLSRLCLPRFFFLSKCVGAGWRHGLGRRLGWVLRGTPTHPNAALCFRLPVCMYVYHLCAVARSVLVSAAADSRRLRPWMRWWVADVLMAHCFLYGSSCFPWCARVCFFSCSLSYTRSCAFLLISLMCGCMRMCACACVCRWARDLCWPWSAPPSPNLYTM